MKLKRRDFIRGCAGTLAGIGIAMVIPFQPEIPGLFANKKEKHPKDVLTCEDFSPQITIQDYVPGAPIKWQELKMDGDCSMCKFEKNCTCCGQKFIETIKGMLNPEVWSRKVQAKLYKASITGKII